MTKEQSLNKALQVKVAAEAFLLALESFGLTELNKSKTKTLTKQVVIHFSHITRSFMEHANEDEKRQHSEAAWMVYEKIKETNIKLNEKP
jgi:hypothetical protein